MRKDISTQLSDIVLDKEEEVSHSEYKINSLILNGWSPSNRRKRMKMSKFLLVATFRQHFVVFIFMIV
jgi:hypothetical protein